MKTVPNPRLFQGACACVLLALAGCSGASTSLEKPRTPYYHSSLTSPNVRPLLPRFATEPGALERKVASALKDKGRADEPNGQAMQKSAPIGREPGSECLGDGGHEAEQVLKKAASPVTWSAADGLGKLVHLAQSRRAYRVDGSPKVGDIVLFHNTHDANGDGQNNDLLSSAGIILAGGAKFEAEVCAQGRLRRVLAWPDGLAVREYRGKLVNSFLRVPTHADPAGTAYLAGSLYAGHIDIDRLVD
ncbi:MAG: hypothetical protein MUC50_14670 [Myxococcota bacterium]|jgi:hypothetical protein|nr:hypothetical protein [Myxococcota bacterium]